MYVLLGWLCFLQQEVVRTLLKHSADATARDKNWQTPLHIAANNNHVQCAEVLVPFVNSLNITDRAGRTALHHAAYEGHVQVRATIISLCRCYLRWCHQVIYAAVCTTCLLWPWSSFFFFFFFFFFFCVCVCVCVCVCIRWFLFCWPRALKVALLTGENVDRCIGRHTEVSHELMLASVWLHCHHGHYSAGYNLEKELAKQIL